MATETATLSVSPGTVLTLSVAFLLLYTAPILALDYYFIVQSGVEYDRLDLIPQFIRVMSEEHTSALNLIHKFLLPLLTFVSAIAMAKPSERGVRTCLLILTVTLLFISISTHIVFSVATDEISEGETTGTEIQLIGGFITRITETLGAYVALLLGLELRPVEQPGVERDVKEARDDLGVAKLQTQG